MDFGIQHGPQEGGPEIDFRVFGGSWGHLGAILGPRWPKTPPRRLCGQILMDFWTILFIDFWWICLSFFGRFLADFQTIWIHFSSTAATTRATNRSTDHQTVKELISYSINQSNIVGTVAGWPKAVGSAAPAGVQGVFKIISQILPTTKSYSLTITDRPLWSINS